MHRSSIKELAAFPRHSFLLHTQVIGYAVGFLTLTALKGDYLGGRKGKGNVCKAFIF